jgi:hypothetical protein
MSLSERTPTVIVDILLDGKEVVSDVKLVMANKYDGSAFLVLVSMEVGKTPVVLYCLLGW